MSKHAPSLKGKPRPQLSRDGKTCRVSPRAQTPLQRQLTELFSKWGGIGAVLAVAVLTLPAILEETAPLWWLAAIPLSGIAGWVLCWLALKRLLSKGCLIIFTQDHIKIRKWLLFSDTYDRMHPHTFALRDHPKTEIEQEKQEFAVRKAGNDGDVIRKTPYCKRSQQLVIEYFGEQIPIMDIYGHDNALRIQGRLQAIDTLHPTRNEPKGRVSVSAKDDWSKQPGGLGENC